MVGEDDFAAWSGLNAKALGADGHAAIGADFEVSAQAPDKGPPGAQRHRAQNGAFLLEGKEPGLLGLHFEFAMDLVLVAMNTQSLDMRISLVEVGDVFAVEVSGQTFLPEEV